MAFPPVKGSKSKASLAADKFEKKMEGSPSEEKSDMSFYKKFGKGAAKPFGKGRKF